MKTIDVVGPAVDLPGNPLSPTQTHSRSTCSLGSQDVVAPKCIPCFCFVPKLNNLLYLIRILYIHIYQCRYTHTHVVLHISNFLIDFTGDPSTSHQWLTRSSESAIRRKAPAGGLQPQARRGSPHSP